ncbi:MAG: hypothetical protein KDB22_30440, partial [Planctomycetales bacterium]|nr:hypothetical protein [Planctomycetales bacterium]
MERQLTGPGDAGRYLPDGDSHTMKPILHFIAIAFIVGCTQSDSSSTPTAGTQDVPPQTIKHGRVTLLAHNIEAGAPNESAVHSGLDSATSVLNDLLEADELKP